MPQQEGGIRSSCPLPYQLYVKGNMKNGEEFEMELEAGNEFFEKQAMGVPFYVYNMYNFEVRNYAVKAGDKIKDSWPVDEDYHLKLYGPNGFFREFKGRKNDPEWQIACEYERKRLNRKKLTGNIELRFTGNNMGQTVEITDNAYKQPKIVKRLSDGNTETVLLNLKNSYGWYDFTIKAEENPYFCRRFAGHVETGEASFTDPFMGRVEI
jgi:phospholipase C